MISYEIKVYLHSMKTNAYLFGRTVCVMLYIHNNYNYNYFCHYKKPRFGVTLKQERLVCSIVMYYTLLFICVCYRQEKTLLACQEETH